MAIDTSTSILSLAGGEYYHIQFQSSSTITSWSLQNNTVPDGMTMSTGGVLSGTPTLASSGSIYKDTVEAIVSGGGVETMDITIGVKLVEERAKAAPRWNFSMDTNQLSLPGGETDPDTGYPITRLKQTDDFIISVGMIKDGLAQKIDVANFAMEVKQYEGESGISVETGFMREVGDTEGYYRYECGIELTDSLFASFLSDEEADVDTKVRLVCDLTMQYWEDVGEASPVLQSRTCSPFHIELSRKL